MDHNRAHYKRQPVTQRPWLWLVLIETNCGYGANPDWQLNGEPEPLGAALDEAFACRLAGFPTMLVPCAA
jgi:hypothetical protein